MTSQFGMSTRVAPSPTSADIGLIVALPIEVGPLLASLTNVRKFSANRFSVVEGELAGKVVAVSVVGMGRKAAARGARLLIEGHHPRWIVSAGFAGGLDPSLQRNDLIMASEVIDLDGGRFTIDVNVPTDGTLRIGRLITVDAIVRLASAKAKLRQDYQADFVDMETSAIASLCAERAQRFLSVRIISDTAEIDLPAEIATIVASSGSYQVGAALSALWKRPSVLGELLSLRQQAVDSATKLSEFLKGALAQLS